MHTDVQAWQEKVIIPTYPVGAPEKNPMFLEKRVYQGSSGVVYPHPIIEKISDQKIDRTYNAVFIENKYLKIMILPELGGRIQMAYDKIKQRHFIYYNQVIKPALVGLLGPWISGGIEFNWPQHHRPSTFEPVDCTITANADGSKTVWINEVERMFRTKGMAAITLYPDKAYIEINGKLYNRTPFPQTFLWWANPAVKVNEHYQSIFPPDVYAVYDHGKRDVSSFPIATGTYYKIDYSPGTDISRYKNIPVPTSFMAVSSKYNFMGGYEHDTKGGLLHVADHHLVPGKKQWTWGNSDFGIAWDKNLTDEDGPYIELMTGVFTDNQPDFSWLQPYEEKEFTQYFMPYSELGEVKNASKEAAVNLTFSGQQIELKLYVTSYYQQLTVELQNEGNSFFSETIACSPEQIFTTQLNFKGAAEDIKVIVTDNNSGEELISYQQEKTAVPDIPAPAMAAKKPGEIDSNEQLFLTGLHIEQYRHATFDAKDYYTEALRRDAKDARCNNAMGLWYLRRGKSKTAETYFRTAVATVTERNPNPYDGEVYYNLGCCLQMQQNWGDAFDAFYKSVWNDAWQHAGYFNLARIAVLQQKYSNALGYIQKSLVKNYHSHSVRHAFVFILRKLNRNEEALKLIDESLTIDPFNIGCLFEKMLLQKSNDNETGAEQTIALIQEQTHGWVHNYIEYAFDYAHAGLFEEATELLLLYTNAAQNKYTLVDYYLGWFALQSGNGKMTRDYFITAGKLNPAFVFPNRVEDVEVLQTAVAINPADANALYYLGNYWYDKRQYADAIDCWEKSALIQQTFPTVHRNLALAYFNKEGNKDKALAAMELAFSLDESDARVLMELDQLYKALNKPLAERLVLLEKYLPLVSSREDLYLERITICNQLGQHEKAKELISHFKFHPWEGGEGKVISQYLCCHLELTKIAITDGRYNDAQELLNSLEHYPINLGEGKLPGTQENDIDYWKGVLYDCLGKKELALKFFKKATNGISEPVQAIFYNDPQPDKIFYQGLAWLKLGDSEKANDIFNRLINFGKQHMDDKISIDYFAVSLPDLLVFDANLNLLNKIHCLYLAGLGSLGLGKENTEEAANYFNEVLELNKSHQGAMIHKKMISKLHDAKLAG